MKMTAGWKQMAAGVRRAGSLTCVFIMLAYFVVSGCAARAATATTGVENWISLSLRHDGRQRTYHLYIPPEYTDGGSSGTEGKPEDLPAPAWPLVLLLHADGSNGREYAEVSGMNTLARQAGFIALYADAAGEKAEWNALGIKDDLPDDLGFLKRLVDEVRRAYRIDEKRIYLIGHAAGGMMGYRLVVEYPRLFAAIATAGASMGVRHQSGSPGENYILTVPPPKHPVSVLAFHGEADKVIPYDGRPPIFGSGEGYLSAAESIQLWVAANRCREVPKRETSHDGLVIEETYSGGTGGTEVVLVTIKKGGHAWPESQEAAEAGAPVLKAGEMIWEFFAAHPLVAPPLNINEEIKRLPPWFTALLIVAGFIIFRTLLRKALHR
ncbi:MAG TPA: hypothetical protein GXX29_04410 [Firmicutes bacterium]|nr:hypothetical protein [Bacillota bacterium]